MFVLSNMDVWLLHNIVSMFLWITFIGLILLILGFGIYTVGKIMGLPEDDEGGDKNGG